MTFRQFRTHLSGDYLYFGGDRAGPVAAAMCEEKQLLDLPVFSIPPANPIHRPTAGYRQRTQDDMACPEKFMTKPMENLPNFAGLSCLKDLQRRASPI